MILLQIKKVGIAIDDAGEAQLAHVSRQRFIFGNGPPIMQAHARETCSLAYRSMVSSTAAICPATFLASRAAASAKASVLSA